MATVKRQSEVEFEGAIHYIKIPQVLAKRARDWEEDISLAYKRTEKEHEIERP